MGIVVAWMGLLYLWQYFAPKMTSYWRNRVSVLTLGIALIIVLVRYYEWKMYLLIFIVYTFVFFFGKYFLRHGLSYMKRGLDYPNRNCGTPLQDYMVELGIIIIVLEIGFFLQTIENMP